MNQSAAVGTGTMPVAAPDRPGGGGLPAVLVALIGFAGILTLGAAVAEGRGQIALLVLAGIGGTVALSAAYVHRPIETVLWFWVFLLAQPLMVDILGGKGGRAGAALTKAENPLLIVLVVVSLVHASRRRPSGRLLIYLPALGYLASGLVSSVLARGPLLATLLGAFLGVKTYAMFTLALLLPWQADDVERVMGFILRLAVPIGALALGDFLTGGAIRGALGLSTSGDVRFGLRSARGIFPIPALLASFMFCSLAVLLARFCYGRRRSDILAISLLSVTAILSLRFKAIVGVGGAFATVLVVNPRRFARQLGAFSLAGIAALLLGSGLIMSVAGQQIDLYLTSKQQTPRGVLFTTSAKIARDRAPLGVGFGRFGSAPSVKPYSAAYDRYGVSAIPGLSRDKPTYLNDTSWPTILGESGILGLIFYAGGLSLIGARLLRQARRRSLDRRCRMASLAGLVSLVVFLLDSSGRPALFDAFTALSVGLFVGSALALAERPGPPLGNANPPARVPDVRRGAPS